MNEILSVETQAYGNRDREAHSLSKGIEVIRLESGEVLVRYNSTYGLYKSEEHYLDNMVHGTGDDPASTVEFDLCWDQTLFKNKDYLRERNREFIMETLSRMVDMMETYGPAVDMCLLSKAAHDIKKAADECL